MNFCMQMHFIGKYLLPYFIPVFSPLLAHSCRSLFLDFYVFPLNPFKLLAHGSLNRILRFMQDMSLWITGTISEKCQSEYFFCSLFIIKC